MKTYQYIIILLLSAIIPYLSVAFTEWSFDPSDWSWSSRAFVAIAFFVITIITMYYSLSHTDSIESLEERLRSINKILKDIENDADLHSSKDEDQVSES